MVGKGIWQERKSNHVGNEDGNGVEEYNGNGNGGKSNGDDNGNNGSGDCDSGVDRSGNGDGDGKGDGGNNENNRDSGGGGCDNDNGGSGDSHDRTPRDRHCFVDSNADTGGGADRGGLTHSIAVGGGAEADDGGTAIDQRHTMTLLL